MKIGGLLIMLVVGLTAFAQDSVVFQIDTLAKFRNVTLQGYIKDLQTLNFDRDFSNVISGNQLHNRLNLNWQPGDFKAVMELRTRFFWGEEVKLTPGFASLLRNSNDKLNLQKTWIDNGSVVLHSNVERLYFDLPVKEWQIRLGRQRINWGVTTTWNPNDIFNVYNFLDFDYEERPGVDGGKLQYLFPNASKAEFAYAFSGKSENVGAFKYSFNKANYDVQLLGGWYKDRPTAGLGWAGYIRNAGFKGEGQMFFPASGSSGHFNLVLEGDYMFDQGLYVNAAVLWNSLGISRSLLIGEQINFDLSPENLMPTKWNLMLTTAREITPLFLMNLGLLYAPGTDLLILIPTLQYNLAPDLDVNLVGQSFFLKMDNDFQAENHRIYLRLKWSF